MRGLIGRWAQFLRDDGGATSIEYALIAGSVSIVIVFAVYATGSTLVARYTLVSDGMKSFK